MLGGRADWNWKFDSTKLLSKHEPVLLPPPPPIKYVRVRRGGKFEKCIRSKDRITLTIQYVNEKKILVRVIIDFFFLIDSEFHFSISWSGQFVCLGLFCLRKITSIFSRVIRLLSHRVSYAIRAG